MSATIGPSTVAMRPSLAQPPLTSSMSSPTITDRFPVAIATVELQTTTTTTAVLCCDIIFHCKNLCNIEHVAKLVCNIIYGAKNEDEKKTATQPFFAGEQYSLCCKYFYNKTFVTNVSATRHLLHKVLQQQFCFNDIRTVLSRWMAPDPTAAEAPAADA